MSMYQKSVILGLLLFGIAAGVFGEGFYGFSNGCYRFTESFPDDNYSRKQSGLNSMFSLYYFPDSFFLGFFAQTAIGNLYPGVEQNGREQTSARNGTIWDMRTTLAPAVKLQLGQKFRIPVSIGPIIIFTREEIQETLRDYYYSSVTRDYTYQAISLGLSGDAALVLNPSSWFFLRHGFAVDWVFLRAEEGEMRMNYRTTHHSDFTITPYSALSTSLYFGIGIRFE